MIMLAIGIWSPKAGLVAIALVSGARLLAQHANPIIYKIVVARPFCVSNS